MKTKRNKILESYFQTENEHWNKYAFNCLVEATEVRIFEDLELPLKLFDNAIELLLKNLQTPVKAIEFLKAEIAKQKLTEGQQLFVLKWVKKYLWETEFEEGNTFDLHKLLEAFIKPFEEATQPAKPRVQNIRETLKITVQNELQQLPETLNELESEKRLSILCKLIPYVLPKIQSIHSERGEGGESSGKFGF